MNQSLAFKTNTLKSIASDNDGDYNSPSRDAQSHFPQINDIKHQQSPNNVPKDQEGNEILQIAYSSSKDPKCKLVIDDIIPIKVHQPKIRMSHEKKAKVFEHQSSKQLLERALHLSTLSNTVADLNPDASVNQDKSNSFEVVTTNQEERQVQSSLQQNLPTIQSNISVNKSQKLMNMRDILKKQTYQPLADPSALQSYNSEYFDSKGDNFIKRRFNRTRYMPPAQSLTFGELQKLKESQNQQNHTGLNKSMNKSGNLELQIKAEEEISREKALLELRQARLSKKLVQTQEIRNKIIERIRIKSTLCVYKNEHQSLEHIQEELNWCSELKVQERDASKEVKRSIFRETMRDQRKAERVQDRIQRRYNHYWNKYNTSINFDAKRYQSVDLNQNQHSKNEQNLPPAIQSNNLKKNLNLVFINR